MCNNGRVLTQKEAGGTFKNLLTSGFLNVWEFTQGKEQNKPTTNC